jgi:hypothetical protein
VLEMMVTEQEHEMLLILREQSGDDVDLRLLMEFNSGRYR